MDGLRVLQRQIAAVAHAVIFGIRRPLVRQLPQNDGVFRGTGFCSRFFPRRFRFAFRCFGRVLSPKSICKQNPRRRVQTVRHDLQKEQYY